MAHHREIVRDEEVSETEPFLQVFEQVDHLPLDRNIERRYRFVADNQFRLERKRARDADALALPARQLVRIALGHVGDTNPLASAIRRRVHCALSSPARCHRPSTARR
jgi:hypothetical protein